MNFEDLTVGDFMSPTEDTLQYTAEAIEMITEYTEVSQRIAVAKLPTPPGNPLKITASRIMNTGADEVRRLEIQDSSAAVIVRVGEMNLSPQLTEYLMDQIKSLMAPGGTQYYVTELELIGDSLLTKDPARAVSRMVRPGSNLRISTMSKAVLNHEMENGHTIECELIHGNGEYVYNNRGIAVPERSTIAGGSPLRAHEGKRYNFAMLPGRQDLRADDMWLIEHDVASLPTDEAEKALQFNPTGAKRGAYKPTDGSLSRFAALLRAAHRSLEREYGPSED